MQEDDCPIRLPARFCPLLPHQTLAPTLPPLCPSLPAHLRLQVPQLRLQLPHPHTRRRRRLPAPPRQSRPAHQHPSPRPSRPPSSFRLPTRTPTPIKDCAPTPLPASLSSPLFLPPAYPHPDANQGLRTNTSPRVPLPPSFLNLPASHPHPSSPTSPGLPSHAAHAPPPPPSPADRPAHPKPRFHTPSAPCKVAHIFNINFSKKGAWFAFSSAFVWFSCSTD
jgi:hypothetical protein